MGTFFRAAIGFAIALTMLHGPAIWDEVKYPAIGRIESDIAATRPAARLEASLAKFLAPQNDTTPRN
jgi:hypothetical protein